VATIVVEPPYQWLVIGKCGSVSQPTILQDSAILSVAFQAVGVENI
jgi:hypothetical protein